MKAQRSLRILVTDAHELAGLGAVRSLGRAGHAVTAGYPDDQSAPPAARSRYCAGVTTYPDPWKRNNEFKQWCAARFDSGAWDVVLPISEAAIVAASSIADALRNPLPILSPSPHSLEVALSKYKSTRRVMAAGLRAPKTVFVHDSAETTWNTDLSSLRFPIVIKTDNHVDEEGAYVKGRTFPVKNAREADFLLRDIGGSRVNVIAQELIPGTGAGAFFLRHGGNIRARFAHRRLHEVPHSGGWSSLRASTHDERLLRLGEDVLNAVGYEGVAMVEFRKSALDGELYFLEINGRLWGSLALALHAGVDFPLLFLQSRVQPDALPADSPSYRSGLRCRNLFPGEIFHLLSLVRADRAAAPVRVKIAAVVKFFGLTLNPFIRHDHFWITDPVPALVNTGGVVAGLFRRTVHRLASRVFRPFEDFRFRRLRANRARPAVAPKKLLFLCYGNICRSAFAERYWNDRLLKTRPGPLSTSTGLHEKARRRTPERIAAIAAEFSIDLSAHRSHAVDAATVAAADLIVVMDRSNHRALLTRFPAARSKVVFLGWFSDDPDDEIADPYLLDDDRARASFQKMVRCLQGLSDALEVH